MKLSVQLGTLSLIESVEFNATDNIHSVRLFTIMYLKAHIPPETGFALATKRKINKHKKHEMYMPNASPNARHLTPPIFHWELGLRLLPNAKKSTHKK